MTKTQKRRGPFNTALALLRTLESGPGTVYKLTLAAGLPGASCTSAGKFLALAELDGFCRISGCDQKGRPIYEATFTRATAHLSEGVRRLPDRRHRQENANGS